MPEPPITSESMSSMFNRTWPALALFALFIGVILIGVFTLSAYTPGMIVVCFIGVCGIIVSGVWLRRLSQTPEDEGDFGADPYGGGV
jgi:Flp pilus assembly protein TadB